MSEPCHGEKRMPPILKTENLVKKYSRRTAVGTKEEVSALDGVSLAILPGQTLAVVGESGSGKSTLAFCIAGFEQATSGQILFEGIGVAELSGSERRKKRPQIQLIFQDPASSLNPRWTVSEILLEPLSLQNKFSAEEMRHRIEILLRSVGLSPELLKKTPRELSGGQRQRLAIARAVALEPKLLILDEALSALDCSVQAQIANLLAELQQTLGITYLFITHDLAMAGHLADEIAVMSHGRIVEQGEAEDVLKQPLHETTRQLLSAVPKLPRATVSVRER
jgi:ABC-type glutathione transport system ATPase component